MAEVCFDIGVGKLAVGEAAIEQAIEQNGYEVVPLKELLTQPNFPFKTGDFELLETKDWNAESYLTFGRWLLHVLEDPVEHPITQPILRRVRTLGLGPPEKDVATKSDCTSLTEFKRQIDAPVRHVRNVYREWTDDHFTQYADQVAEAAGRYPKREDYMTYATTHGGPSVEVINGRFGNVTNLNEKAGQHDPSKWDSERAIDWGVEVMHANDGELTWRAPLILEGLPFKSALRLFGSWPSYETATGERYTKLQPDNPLRNAERYKLLIARSALPYAFRYLPDGELVRYSARYVLAQKFLPFESEEYLYQISDQLDAPIENFIAKDKTRTTRLKIRHTALELGIYNDLWPVVYRQELHITPEMVAAHSERRKRESRQRQLRKQIAV